MKQVRRATADDGKVLLRQIRGWFTYNVQQCCISNNLYTKGTGDDYDKMLAFVQENSPAIENVYRVAKDIFEHSDQSEAGTITNVMFLLEDEAIHTTYEIAGEE